MVVAAVEITFVEVPQRPPVAPYRSHVRSSSATRSAIVRLQADDGRVGWGEYNVNFLPLEPLAADARSAPEWLIGRDARNLARFHAECPFEPRLRSGLEMALWDLCAQAAGVPLAVLLGGVLRPQVELAACMGIQSPGRAGEIAGHYLESGYGTLKMKGGIGVPDDVAMVAGVRAAVSDRLRLRLDPNRAYDPQAGLELARRLEEFDLEYLEQPIPAEPLADAVRLRERTRTPQALNESVSDPASAWEILKVGAAAYLLPDTPQAGGILPCMAIGHLCAAAGVPCIMHCGHDLGPKTAAMVHVAAASPAYSLANDSTYDGLESDICVEPLAIRSGRIEVPSTPGLGVAGDRRLLERYRIAG